MCFIGLSCVAKGEESRELASELTDTTQALAGAISRANGWDRESTAINGCDLSDARVGRGLAYTFRVEAGGGAPPRELSFSEPLASWESLLPQAGGGAESAALPPFDLAGPLELWVQDAQQLRLSMLQEVDARELQRVEIAEGAVLRVHGAQSVGLAAPIQLPPAVASGPGDRCAGRSDVAAGLLALTARLRAAARSQSLPGCGAQQLSSLRVARPTALEAVGGGPGGGGILLVGGWSNGSSGAGAGRRPRSAAGSGGGCGAARRAGVRRLSEELAAELGWRQQRHEVAAPDWLAEAEGADPRAWPPPGARAADPRLVAVEAALGGDWTAQDERGPFRVLSARAEPVRVVRVQFEAEGQRRPGGVGRERLLAERLVAARLSPVERQVWELTARVDAGGAVRPVQVRQVAPLGSTISLAVTDLLENGTAWGPGPSALPPLGLSALGEGLP